jgi:ribosomal protein S18 acetylase RimI-like enzyme
VATTIALRDLAPADLPAAANLLGRAYRDNPLMFALLGDDPAVRESVNEQIQLVRLEALEAVILAVDDEAIVGVCGYEKPDTPAMPEHIVKRWIEVLSAAGPVIAQRASQMLADFAALSYKEPHWQLGPVAVSPDVQGSGIGSRMVREFCARVDAEHGLAHLDTDKPENVRLYERFGFEIFAEQMVLGTRTWSMVRPPTEP